MFNESDESSSDYDNYDNDEATCSDYSTQGKL